MDILHTLRVNRSFFLCILEKLSLNRSGIRSQRRSRWLPERTSPRAKQVAVRFFSAVNAAKRNWKALSNTALVSIAMTELL